MKEGAQAHDLDQFFIKATWPSIANSGRLSGNEYLVECLERIVAPLFAFFLMKDRRPGESYSSAPHNTKRSLKRCPAERGKLRAAD